MRTTFLILWLLSFSVYAQTETSMSGAMSRGMADALVGASHAYSFFDNPAGVGAQGTQLSSAYDTRFDLAELSTVSASFTYAQKWGNLAIGGERFGGELYNVNKVGLGYAKKLNYVSLGVKTSILNSSFKDLSAHQTFITELGVIANMWPQLSIGLHAINVTGGTQKSGSPYPTTLRGGIYFTPAKALAIAAETSYILNEYANVKVGLQYALKDRLFIRTGVNTGLKTNHFGFGYLYQKWQFDYAIDTHSALGISHHLNLTMRFQQQ